MKKLLVALAAVLVTAATYGQGTVNFDNVGINAPIFAAGGTAAGTGAGTLAGAQAGLYVSSDGTANGTFTLVPGSVTTFFGNSGVAAQFLNALTVSVPSVVPGTAGMFKIGAWVGGSDFATATSQHGFSNPVTVTTGGNGTPPALPGDLNGITQFELVPVPEPSTIAFGVIGGLALLLRRRK
jgi:hypothetical protein